MIVPFQAMMRKDATLEDVDHLVKMLETMKQKSSDRKLQCSLVLTGQANY